MKTKFFDWLSCIIYLNTKSLSELSGIFGVAWTRLLIAKRLI